MSDLKHTKDENGKEVLLKEDLHPVMMEWEKKYVEACVDAIKPKGSDVLEIGYALGYAANRIQEQQPNSHTIIESDSNVAKEAKEWAKEQKSNINIIEGKWQKKLVELGKFDAIFLNDYIPYEKEELQKLIQETEQYEEAIEEAKSLRSELAENLSQLRGIKFSDPEIKAFGEQILAKPGVTMREVTDFMDYLEEMEHITPKQKADFFKEFEQSASKKYIPKGSSTTFKSDATLNKAFLGDRLLAFIETCLDWHLKPGGRLSAYVGNPQSKKEDADFARRILSRKDVNYSEKFIPVDVPENCPYYTSDKALVFVIEKK